MLSQIAAHFSPEEIERITNFKRFKRKGSSSKYQGVFYVKKERKFRAQICMKGKKRYVGTFTNDKDAAVARDKVIRQLFGEVVELLNFPNPNSPQISLLPSFASGQQHFIHSPQSQTFNNTFQQQQQQQQFCSNLTGSVHEESNAKNYCQNSLRKVSDYNDASLLNKLPAIQEHRENMNEFQKFANGLEPESEDSKLTTAKVKHEKYDNSSSESESSHSEYSETDEKNPNKKKASKKHNKIRNKFKHKKVKLFTEENFQTQAQGQNFVNNQQIHNVNENYVELERTNLNRYGSSNVSNQSLGFSNIDFDQLTNLNSFQNYSQLNLNNISQFTNVNNMASQFASESGLNVNNMAQTNLLNPFNNQNTMNFPVNYIQNMNGFGNVNNLNNYQNFLIHNIPEFNQLNNMPQFNNFNFNHVNNISPKGIMTKRFSSAETNLTLENQNFNNLQHSENVSNFLMNNVLNQSENRKNSVVSVSALLNINQNISETVPGIHEMTESNIHDNSNNNSINGAEVENFVMH